MKFQLIHPDAKLPTRGSEEAAGLDLYAIDDAEIRIGEWKMIDLGIASMIPRGCVAIIKDRSSLAARGIITAGGVIDSDYRGEWKVVIGNMMPGNSFRISRGDRIAQVVVVGCLLDPPMKTDEITATRRGKGGFGSTGK